MQRNSPSTGFKTKKLIQNLLDRNASPPKGSWLPSVGDVLNAPTRDTVATDCTRGCLTSCGGLISRRSMHQRCCCKNSTEDHLSLS